MSYSRAIAIAAQNPNQLEAMFASVAKEILAKGGRREQFDAAMRPHFHALHAGGFAKEKLKQLHKLSREVFYKISQTHPSGGLPARLYVRQDEPGAVGDPS